MTPRAGEADMTGHLSGSESAADASGPASPDGRVGVMLDGITRQPALSRLSPLTVSRISVGFALITALWLAVASVHGEVIALIAAGGVVICGQLSRPPGRAGAGGV